MRILMLVPFVSCGFLKGLDDDGKEDDHADGSMVGSHENVRQILDTNCISCHSTGSVSPDLEGDLCETLVDVESTVAGVMLVAPYDSANSYLMAKIDGTFENLGGGGAQMPASGAFLSENKQRAIKTWIEEGASCDSSAFQDTGEESEPGEPGEPSEPSEPSQPTSEPDSNPDAASTFADVDSLFIAGGCHDCHSNSSVSPDMTHDSLVDIPSGQVPTMDYIAPNDVTNSYLYHKIAGTHLDMAVGGQGSQMPLARTPFTLEELAVFESWINEGALE